MARAAPAVVILAALCALLAGAAAAPAGAAGQCLVISEVYGGGGNLGAPYNRDFVELSNRCAQAASLSGFSLQYASASGSFSSVTPLAGTVASRGFFLVAFGTPGSTGAAVAADLQAESPSLSATAGKVALSSGTTALGAVCPAGSVIDLVGYGAAATCFEGAGPTPSPSNTLSASRASICSDTDNNSVDFAAVAPTPQDSGSPQGQACAAAVRLVGFTAMASAAGTRIRWTTASESRTLGFNVLRVHSRRTVRLNRSIIPAGRKASHAGDRLYTWLDRLPRKARRATRYVLEEVSLEGRITRHGPISTRAPREGKR